MGIVWTKSSVLPAPLGLDPFLTTPHPPPSLNRSQSIQAPPPNSAQVQNPGSPSWAARYSQSRTIPGQYFSATVQSTQSSTSSRSHAPIKKLELVDFLALADRLARPRTSKPPTLATVQSTQSPTSSRNHAPIKKLELADFLALADRLARPRTSKPPIPRHTPIVEVPNDRPKRAIGRPTASEAADILLTFYGQRDQVQHETQSLRESIKYK